VAALALGVALGWWRTRLRRPLLGGLLLLGALPGLALVMAQRGDAPPSRGAMAQQVEAAIAAVQLEVGWPRTFAQVVREDDDVLFPVGRYALPSRPPLADAGSLLELRGPSLEAGCRTDEATGHRVCGSGP
jgi:hypothetical protein